MAICIITARIEEGRAACPKSGKRDLHIGPIGDGTDCGADCLQCMAAAGDPECIEEIPKIEVSEQL
ncbi:MAG: hypothetical protein ABSC15_20050 [Terriglobales bacterium]